MVAIIIKGYEYQGCLEVMRLADILFKLILAALLGSLIGAEREAHGRSAGFRTHILVAISGALVMILSEHVFNMYSHLSEESVLRIDPGRIASYAIGGMGFMGAGVILKGKGSVRGITTAACMWTLTVVGLCVGCGLYLAAILTTLVVITILWFRVQVPRLLPRMHFFLQLNIESLDQEGQLRRIENVLNSQGIRLLFGGYDKKISEGKISYNLAIISKGQKDWTEVGNELATINGIERITWEQGYVP